MLLSGAMMVAMTTTLAAQVAHQADAQPKYPIDVAFTYNAAYSGTSGSQSFWMQGGSAEVDATLLRGFGLAASFAGLHTGNINASGVALDLVTATFGPRYAWKPAKGKYSIFAKALVGEGFGFDSVFPGTSGSSTTAYNLAIEAGGGIDIALRPHLSVRALDADWLRTQLPNATTNTQNNLRLGAGVVVRFR
jgi:hypothetical protein